MDSLNEQLTQLQLNSQSLPNRPSTQLYSGGSSDPNLKKVGPAVPPKPFKRILPQIPQSSIVKQACEPLYSKRLNPIDGNNDDRHSSMSNTTVSNVQQQQQQKLPDNTITSKIKNLSSNFQSPNYIYSNMKMTLDNPAILDQQLEALEYHKKQLEKKGVLSAGSGSGISSLQKQTGGGGVGILHLNENERCGTPGATNLHQHLYSNIDSTQDIKQPKKSDIIYSNILHNNSQNDNLNFSNDELPPPPPIDVPPPPTPPTIDTSINEYLQESTEDELPPPPSPVSSSYSELRRATDNFPHHHHHHNLHHHHIQQYPTMYTDNNSSNSVNSTCNPNGILHDSQISGINSDSGRCGGVGGGGGSTMGTDSVQQIYVNTAYPNEYTQYTDPGGSRSSSTYESIYEPINPRPPSQLSSRSNYSLYTSYVNGSQNSGGVDSTGLNKNGIVDHINNYAVSGGSTTPSTISETNTKSHNQNKAEAEVEVLTDLLVNSMNGGGGGSGGVGVGSVGETDVYSYGICVKCGERVVGESSGCTAMEQIYHITCFTCSDCLINLQGKPFYALDGKPYCEDDYLNTLEKCSVCMKPILERILRATGKPYHPGCFCCVVCGNSLDGIPFTVDATNQNYCIEDFHRKFAPRCCVCHQPIMPEPGQEETVRVVALDRSFHFECYKCEDCGLLLSSEAEGRGCYPLDDHVLCKSCNAKRVQTLTNCMTTEL